MVAIIVWMDDTIVKCGNRPARTLAVTINAVTPVTISGNPGNYNFCS
jgi:hypothetical protein